jgi:hypothetical protein
VIDDQLTRLFDRACRHFDAATEAYIRGDRREWMVQRLAHQMCWAAYRAATNTAP